MNGQKQSTITASEIGNYVYCKRGWYLREHGLLQTNASMMQGTVEHNNLFRLVSRHKILSLLVLIFLGIGTILLIVWFALTSLF